MTGKIDLWTLKIPLTLEDKIPHKYETVHEYLALDSRVSQGGKYFSIFTIKIWRLYWKPWKHGWLVHKKMGVKPLKVLGCNIVFQQNKTANSDTKWEI